MQTIYKFKTIETFLPKSSNQAYYSLHTETINAATPSVAHFLYQDLQSHKSLFPRSRFMEQALPAHGGGRPRRRVRAGARDEFTQKLVQFASRPGTSPTD